MEEEEEDFLFNDTVEGGTQGACGYKYYGLEFCFSCPLPYALGRDVWALLF
jgi:hypothetical protein